MNIFRTPGVIIVMLFLAVLTGAQRNLDRFVPDELLVKYAPEANSAVKRRAGANMGAEFIEELGDLGWVRIRIPRRMALNVAAARLLRSPGIVSVQPNYYYRLLQTPDDPKFPESGMFGLPAISAPLAWDMSTGSRDVVVAVVDTGMRYSHEDLAANVWTNPAEIDGNGIDDDGNGFVDDVHGYDFFFDDPDPIDENGHGTHVTGTVGAVGNNGLGVVGVNWAVSLMAIKIFSPTGSGTTTAMVLNAYNYIRMMRQRGVNIRVTNNSFGGCDENCGFDQAMKDSIDALGDADILNIFAAGNGNTDIDAAPFYPASYTSPSVVSVASSTSLDTRSGFSNFGMESVDLAAPGTVILSTTFGADDTYGILSGTSMATPHVTGAAALLAAAHPELSASSLKATLLNNVDPLPDWTGIVKTGGRLNVAAALQNPTDCSFALSATSFPVRTKGGLFTVDVTAPPNCDYLIRSNVKWIHVLGADTRSGDSEIVFRVSFNSRIARSAAIELGGKSIIVTQSRN